MAILEASKRLLKLQAKGECLLSAFAKEDERRIHGLTWVPKWRSRSLAKFRREI
jgi:hypothetical protein